MRRSAGLAILAAAVAAAGACSLDPFGELPDPRRARDCVAFTKEASRDAGQDGDGILRPGVKPGLDIDAYWFGPTFGPRRAIVATASMQDFSNTDEPRLFATYTVFYQRPEDGCQSGLLPGYEEAPAYWGPGDEIQVSSDPLGTPLTQRTIREAFGGREGKPRFRLETGETAILLGSAENETAIVVGRALVLVHGASPDRVRERLGTLRRVA
jgi:hypothetical protein